MENKRKNLIKNLIIDFVVGALIVAFVWYFSQDEAEALGYDVFHILHNGCFSAGVLLLGSGLILFCADKGAFNLFGYSLKYAINLIIPMGNSPWRGGGDRETYYDYCQRQAEKPSRAVLPLIIVGGGYFLMSVVFVLIHYKL